VWDLPAPFDAAAWLASWAVIAAWQSYLRICRNVSWLGIWWLLAYWLTVCGLFALGGWGLAHINRRRQGNDFLEFANNQARWTGRLTTRLYQGVIIADARLGFAILAFPAAIGLLLVGLLGVWLLPLVALWLVVKAAEISRQRRRRLTGRRS
jgi:hypothetical protein